VRFSLQTILVRKGEMAVEKRRIGMLTGGGDAPGLNAVIRAVTVKAVKEGFEVFGFRDGWAGMLKKDYKVLTLEDVEDIHRKGGTILGSSRTNVAKVENGFEIVKSNMDELNIYALIAIGGEDTLGVAKQLYDNGGRVIGVPKTIDNDVNATDYTFGFDTAINRVTETLDWLHTTTESHHRVMVVEIMGRHAGWMALHGGIAGGAHVILIPEVKFDTDEVCEIIKKRYAEGKNYAIVAVAEGAEDPKISDKIKHAKRRDQFGHVLLGTGRGIGEVLAEEIEERTGFETRHIVLGHLQRGGNPSAFDRVLGTRFGLKAVDLVKEGKFGYMVSLRGCDIVPVPLADAVGELKNVDPKLYEEIRIFFE